MLAVVVLASSTSVAQRQMENLNRGVVAVRSGSSTAFVSWRLLGLDTNSIAFNVYRSANGGAWTKRNGSPLTGGCNFADTGVNFSLSNAYRVVPVIGGIEQDPSESWTLPANVVEEPLFTIPMQPPANRRAEKVWVGDVDGDGAYEYVVCWTGTTSGQTQKLQTYRVDGTLLWEMDFGPESVDSDNIYVKSAAISAGQWDGVTVYDLDSDGRAEVIVKSANGVTFGDGTTLGHGDDLTQFISVLDGMTGAEKARTELPNPWKNDNFYPLGTLFGIGYADGERPSLYIHAKNRTGGGGTPFNTIESAWDYRDGVITNRWSIQWNGATGPAAGHQIRVVDVDGDGRDDLYPGVHTVSSDGVLMYDLADLGMTHGDRWQVGDLDPGRPGLEAYAIQQNNASGVAEFMHDPATGAMIWTNNIGAVVDAARGSATDLDPNYPGMECWSFYGMHAVDGSVILVNDPVRPWPNLVVWWNGDLFGDNLNENIVDKWNYDSQSSSRLLTGYHYHNIQSNSRNISAFQGDIIGDWREEIVFDTASHTELVVFTTDIPTTHRLYTLAHNPAYRNGLTTQGYRQQHLPDYYLGDGMSIPPMPDIVYVQLAQPLPAAPAGLNATALSTNRIDLSWTAVSNAVSYHVKRADTSGGTFSIIATNVTGTSYMDLGLSEDTTYYYAVSSVNPNGEGYDSVAASATTLVGTPPPQSTTTVAFINDTDGWVGNTFETLDATQISGGRDNYWSIAPADATGYGQTFDVASAFTVDKLRFWILAYNSAVPIQIDIHYNVDVTASQAAIVGTTNNLLTSIVVVPDSPTTVNEDRVFEVDLADVEQFEIGPLAGNLGYYVHVHSEAGAGSTANFFRWNSRNSGYAGGQGVDKDGTDLGGGRDFGFALVKAPETASPYEFWLAGYPGVGSYTAMTDNPDGDALNNFGEFALGGNPADGNDTGHAPTSFVALAGGSNWFYYVYPKRIDAAEAGLAYHVEHAASLTNSWTNAFYEVTGTGLWSGAESEFHAVTNRISTDAEDAQFLRLKIESSD